VRVVLHGHGTRARGVWGSEELGGAPELVDVRVRRYHCQKCGAVPVVGPRGLVPGYMYLATSIGLALWMWGALGRRDAEVREAVGINRVTGTSRPERWPTVRRWARAAVAGRIWRSIQSGAEGQRRELAERVSRILCARAGPAGSAEERIWSASEHVR